MSTMRMGMMRNGAAGRGLLLLLPTLSAALQPLLEASVGAPLLEDPGRDVSQLMLEAYTVAEGGAAGCPAGYSIITDFNRCTAAGEALGAMDLTSEQIPGEFVGCVMDVVKEQLFFRSGSWGIETSPSVADLQQEASIALPSNLGYLCEKHPEAPRNEAAKEEIYEAKSPIGAEVLLYIEGLRLRLPGHDEDASKQAQQPTAEAQQQNAVAGAASPPKPDASSNSSSSSNISSSSSSSNSSGNAASAALVGNANAAANHSEVLPGVALRTLTPRLSQRVEDLITKAVNKTFHEALMAGVSVEQVSLKDGSSKGSLTVKVIINATMCGVDGEFLQSMISEQANTLNLIASETISDIPDVDGQVQVSLVGVRAWGSKTTTSTTNETVEEGSDAALQASEVNAGGDGGDGRGLLDEADGTANTTWVVVGFMIVVASGVLLVAASARGTRRWDGTALAMTSSRSTISPKRLLKQQRRQQRQQQRQQELDRLRDLEEGAGLRLDLLFEENLDF